MHTSRTVVTALYEFHGDELKSQLSFPAGANISTTVVPGVDENPGWRWGTFDGNAGWFPSNFVYYAEERQAQNLQKDRSDMQRETAEIGCAFDEGFSNEPILGGVATQAHTSHEGFGSTFNPALEDVYQSKLDRCNDNIKTNAAKESTGSKVTRIGQHLFSKSRNEPPPIGFVTVTDIPPPKDKADSNPSVFIDNKPQISTATNTEEHKRQLLEQTLLIERHRVRQQEIKIQEQQNLIDKQRDHMNAMQNGCFWRFKRGVAPQKHTASNK